VLPVGRDEIPPKNFLQQKTAQTCTYLKAFHKFISHLQFVWHENTHLKNGKKNFLIIFLLNTVHKNPKNCLKWGISTKAKNFPALNQSFPIPQIWQHCLHTCTLELFFLFH
jgi:hypothetical protein